jgi:hypothetical protein
VYCSSVNALTFIILGWRSAVLDPELYQSLGELKGFRHLVRHRYDFDLKPEKVQENVDRIRVAFPAFVGAIVSLEKGLTEENTHDNEGGDGSGGRATGGPRRA